MKIVGRRWAGVLAVGAIAGTVAAGPAYAVPPPAYSDDLVVRLAGVERMPSADAATCDDRGVCGPGGAPGTRLVRIDIALSVPPGQPTVPLAILAGTRTGIDLRTAFGAADVDCGNLAETDVLCTDISAAPPVRVDPGAAPVVLCESFDVPVGSLDDLIVTVEPPVRDGPAPIATFHIVGV
jgi:hypothetical protein